MEYSNSHSLQLLVADSLAPKTLVLAFIIAVSLRWFYVLVKTRLEYRNLPGPPHSFLFGHLLPLIKTALRYPLDVHPNVVFNDLAKEFSLVESGLFYLDAYPLRNDKQLIITSPDVAAQVAKTCKHPSVAEMFGTVLGRNTMALSNGEQWKAMHGTFAPAFSPANIFSLMPAILEETETFVTLLSVAASTDGGYIRSLEEMLKALSFDLVCRVVLGKRIRSQEKRCEFAELLHAAARWPNPASLNPLEKYNIVKILMLNYYEKRIKKITDKMVLDRWDEVRGGLTLEKTKATATESRVIIDMALRSCYQNGQIHDTTSSTIPSGILGILSDNVKGFIFGGEDTAANALAWTFFELSRRPDVLEIMRREHRSVLGPDVNEIPNILRGQPRLINQLPYTAAVLKESMRLYPPAASLRIGDEGQGLPANLVYLKLSLTKICSMELTFDGQKYPTKGHMIFLTPYIMHRSERFFPDPDVFIPERWLDGTASSAGKAFRPFEHGQRSCAGQELAMIEMQVILALTVGKFEFAGGYEELHVREGRDGPIPAVEGHGDHAYPVIFTTPHPKEGLPVIVKEFCAT
ncbi:cytochrome P450 [Xylariales sp. PMI_506]|nr:cytochrome P450 [Xylariales sp. PMI_506]